MISKKAIKHFLDRKLNNWDFTKKYNHRDLNSEINELFPRLRTRGIELWMHQKACFLLMLYLKRFILFLDMGTGKTLLSLLIISHRKQMGEKPCAVVFVPFVTTVSTWIDEVKEKMPHLTCIPLIHGGVKNKELLLNERPDLFVICYQTAVTMIGEKEYNIKKKKNQLNFSANKVRHYFKNIDMLIMDESHRIKNHLSLTFRMCRAISTNVEWVYALTGTPFGRDLMDLWGQFFVVDLGETLGETLGIFRESFFTKKENFWGGVDYTFKKNLYEDLIGVIKNRSVRYKIKECRGMPKQQYYKRHFDPTNDMINYGRTSLDKLRSMMKSGTKKRDLKAIKSTTVLLSQLGSGFITLKDDNDKKLIIDFDENPKLEALIEHIDSMPQDSKMVVFHNWVHTNKIISDRLTKEKIGHARIWGGQKNQLDELKRFKRNKTCRVLVCNSQSGSSSLNLQHANYIVFFEQPRSSIERQQGERRCWRPGQKKRVIFCDFLMRRTLDEKQLDNNKEGKDLLRFILDNKSQLGDLL